jgi:hypothetical protein
MLAVLICVIFTWPLVALSQEIDEGEFSRKMLGYKLQLLKNQFEQTEMRLLTQSVAGTTLKKLDRVYTGIKRLEVGAGDITLIYSMNRSSLFAKNFGYSLRIRSRQGQRHSQPLSSLESNRYQLGTSSVG